MHRLFVSLLVGLLLAGRLSFALADDMSDCMSAEDPDVKIKGCTVLLEPGKSPPDLLFTFLLLRADGWMMKQEYDRALADIEQARKLSPNSPGAYSARAQVHLQRSEFTLALVYINKAIELAKPPSMKRRRTTITRAVGSMS